MNLFLKFCIILDALFIFRLLAGLIEAGRLCRIHGSEYEYVAHRTYRIRLYVSFLVLLVFVFGLRRDDLSEHGRIGTLLIVHWIAVAILSIVTALIEWRYSGKNRRDIHYLFAYLGFTPALVVVVITGTILTMQA